MNRAVFVSACGDPFILMTLYRLFQKRWYGEITTFYVNLNNHCKAPKEVIVELLSRLSEDPKTHIIYHPEGRGNGPPITEMVQVAKEDLVLLLEDDFFIFKSGVVDEFFKKIEAGETDILGSPRYTHGEVADAAKRKYNLDYSGVGDKGFGWWPTGFYCKRKDLLRTDLDFGSKAYRKGEYFKELDYTFKETCYTDTFTWASLQLRHLGLRSLDIPQHHADPYEIESKQKGEMNWSGEPMRWIHGGSLSAGVGGYLSGRVPDVSHPIAKLEMETRVAFWTIASDMVEGFDEFKKLYRRGIKDLIVNAKLDNERIKKKKRIYKELMQI